MRRQRLDSTSLASVGYDPAKNLLEVEFRNGGIYQYLEVDDHEYDGFREAESKGRFLNTEIKPTHRYRLLKKPD